MTRRFQRRAEDFTCAHCGESVRGDGYTNHCPRCLWSRHVDVAPGDREHPCRGMMEPTAVEPRGDGYALRHTCIECGAVKTNRSDAADDRDAILALATRRAEAVARGGRRPGPVRKR